MDLYEAILKRKSVRHFESRNIPKEVVENILEYAKSVEPLNGKIKINIEIIENSKKAFRAPYYIAIYSEEKDNYCENAGYVMQYIVMYLTVMGLGSCYQGVTNAMAKKDALGRKRIITVAFGYASEENMRDPLRASRLTQKDICIFKEEPNANIYKLAEAVRMSPSSLNSQPWRLVIYNSHMHIFVKTSLLKTNRDLNKINIGIALANVDMAADCQWIDIRKKRIPAIEAKSTKKLNYVISLKNI